MTSPSIVSILPAQREPQILIACEDDAVAHELQSIFRAANLDSLCTKSIATAAHFAMSGRFRVIFTAPSFQDGSWRHLVDVSRHSAAAPAVVVVARSFDMSEWGASLKYGAFDVLDSLLEIPRAAEVAVRAFSKDSSNLFAVAKADSRSPEAA